MIFQAQQSELLYHPSLPSKIRPGGPNLRYFAEPIRSRLAFILSSRFNEWPDHIFPFFQKTL